MHATQPPPPSRTDHHGRLMTRRRAPPRGAGSSGARRIMRRSGARREATMAAQTASRSGYATRLNSSVVRASTSRWAGVSSGSMCVRVYQMLTALPTSMGNTAAVPINSSGCRPGQFTLDDLVGARGGLAEAAHREGRERAVDLREAAVDLTVREREEAPPP